MAAGEQRGAEQPRFDDRSWGAATLPHAFDKKHAFAREHLAFAPAQNQVLRIVQTGPVADRDGFSKLVELETARKAAIPAPTRWRRAGGWAWPSPISTDPWGAR